MRVVFHPEADAELNAAAGWYDGRVRGLGAAFLDETDAAISRIITTPEAFGFVRSDVRCPLLHRFPFGILYRVESDRIFILAVMHLARNPRYWEHRV